MYVPLRVHGHHSLLTGVDSPAELLARARELGLPALALCDVDGMGGTVDFLRAAAPPVAERPLHPVQPMPQAARPIPQAVRPIPQAVRPIPQAVRPIPQAVRPIPQAVRPIPQAVRPIIGAELSDPSGPGRLIALVRTRAGYANLCRLITERQLGGALGTPESERGPHGHGGPGGTGGVDGGAPFDLAASAARHHEGLFLLADHPRLLLALFGRVPARTLFAALSPAAVRLARKGRSDATALRPSESRNTHLSPPLARRRAVALERDDGEAALEPPKTPPPAAPVDALELVEAARAVGAATLAVPDVYYARAQGAAAHRVRVAIKHNALADDLPPGWLAAEPAHLPTPAELDALFAELPDVPGAWKHETPRNGSPGAVARTLAVAAECAYVPPLDGVAFPEIELAGAETPYSRLAALAFEGARARYRPMKPEVVRRLDYELAAIESLGFSPYFLLVRKIAVFARERKIPHVGRGSAADSLVAYCLGLTDADPLRYRLPFERFLNPARQDRPDIDLDFCWRRRDEVLEHVYTAFGPERTAMICTLNCFGLRSAFREAALVCGLPPAEINVWSRRLPWMPPSREETRAAACARTTPELLANPIARALLTTPECRGFPFDDERWRRVLAAAERLLDTPRHFGLHPGGVVVAPGSITDFVACQRAAKGVVVTQLDKDAIEAVGLVKMDLLGNRALTVIDDCLAVLAERGITLDLTQIPEDDVRTAEVLGEGRTLGCFQVESPGMRNLLQQIGARTMDDVIQAVALIRPGPAGSGMKDAYVRRFRGREAPTPPHPRLTELLWDTHGVMLYQEDVMQVAATLAGMDLAEADLLRRALSKHRTRELERQRERFLAGCEANGVERADSVRVWELIANFASFGFCKAHAVTYGRIAYRAVYLKTHHPALYLAAFLNSHTGYYEPRVYVEEARRLGVPILGPDVNKSARGFAIEWSDDTTPCLRVGLESVRGLGAATLDAILSGRAEKGLFLSLPDFLERTGAHSDEAMHLVQCGAFDAFDRTRPELLWRLQLLRTPQRRAPRDLHHSADGALDLHQLAACRATPASRARDAVANARAGARGWNGASIGLGRAQLRPGECAPLFPEPETPGLVLPGLPDLTPLERGRLELELLGLTVGMHPVQLLPCAGDERLAQMERRPPNLKPCRAVARGPLERLTLRGWLAASRRVRTSDGKWMRFLTLEDESGTAEVVLFPDVYRRDGHLLTSRGPFLITGTAQDQLGARTLTAERIW